MTENRASTFRVLSRVARSSAAGLLLAQFPLLPSLLGCLLALMFLSTPAAAQRLMTEMPKPVRGLELADHLGQTIPLDLTFTNEDGDTVPLRQYFGKPAGASSPDAPEAPTGTKPAHTKPVVLVMVYYRCPILCPLVLEKFTKTLNQIDFTVGKEYDALIVSFDPRDTPADAKVQKSTQLLAYDRPVDDDVRSGWTYLTGTPEHARALADALGFPYRFLPDSNEFAHGSAVYVLTGDGKISRFFAGLTYPPKDVRFSLLEATNGRIAGNGIGGVLDRFTLWCYHFDPESGAYTLQAFRVMQVAGALTVLLLGGLVLSLVLWERRKPATLANPVEQGAVAYPCSSAVPPMNGHVLPPQRLPARSVFSGSAR